MTIVSAATGAGTTLRNLLRLFPRIGSVANSAQGIRTAWSDPPTNEQLASVGYQYLVETEQPTPGQNEQVRQGPHALIDGQWTQTWVVEPSPVPEEVDTIAFKLTLHDLGILAAAQTYVDGLSPVEQIYWQHRTSMRRDSEFIETGRDALGLTHAQVDNIFRLAAGRTT